MSDSNLFDRFGGVRPMAEALGEKPSTVQSWKTSGRVPAGKQPDVLTRAEQLHLDVDAWDVIFPLSRRPVRAVAIPSETADIAYDRGAVSHRSAAR